MKNYHLIKYHYSTGEDDGADVETMKQAIQTAQRYLLVNNPDYQFCEKVYIFYFGTLLRVFDKNHLQHGRRPYNNELNRN